MRALLTSLWLLLPLLLLTPLVAPAELQGVVYDETLEPMRNALIEIDTTPRQRLLSTDGTYRFVLPPGNYTILVTYPGDLGNATARDTVTVVGDGTFQFDLFVFPGLEDVAELEDEYEPAPEVPFETQSVLPELLLIIAALLLGGLYVLYRLHAKAPSRALRESDDAEAALRILREAGGRMTQKELRKLLGQGEAKTSLLIADLEGRGLIRKVKQGRGNIIILQ